MQNLTLLYFLMNLITGTMAMTLIVLFYVFKGPEVYKYASRLMLVFWLWIVTELLEYFTFFPERKDFYNKLQYVAISLLPVYWISFCHYIRTGHPILRAWRRRLLYLYPLVIIPLVYTNPLHHLLWAPPQSLPGVYPLLKQMYPLFDLFIITVFAGILAGVLMIILPGRNVRRRNAGHYLIVLFGLLGFAIAFWEWKTGYAFPFEITPLTLSLVGLSAMVTIKRSIRTQVLLNRYNVLYALKDPLFLVDHEGMILFANRTAIKEFDIEKDEFFEKTLGSLIRPLDSLSEEIIFHNNHFYSVNINSVLRERDSVYSVALTEVTALKDSELSLKHLTDELEKQVENRTEKLNQSNRELEKLVEEKDILLQEVHHRVNNNLQLIISLLNLQSTRSEDPELRDRLGDAVSRVQTISMVHQMLYRSEDFSRINLRVYLESLIRSMLSEAHAEPELELCDLICSTNTCIQVGMIMNEVILNALKYAYPLDEKNKRFSVISRIEKKQDGSDRLHIRFRDFGRGIDEDVLQDVERDSLGFRIIRTLTEQRKGNIEIYNDGGCVYELDVEI